MPGVDLSPLRPCWAAAGLPPRALDVFDPSPSGWTRESPMGLSQGLRLERIMMDARAFPEVSFKLPVTRRSPALLPPTLLSVSLSHSTHFLVYYVTY